MPHDHDPDHDHDHGHGHGHVHAPRTFGRAFATGAALNIALVVAQIACGLIAGSTALLADAVHNAGDVLGLLLAWGAFLLGRRAPTAQRTYGWGRGTILAALINAVVLLVGVGAIALESLQRLSAPGEVASTLVVWAAGAGIVINGFTAWLFVGGGQDLNVRATFLHMAGDTAVSAGVVVAALVIGATGWSWLDPAVGLAIAALIGLSSWNLLREAMNLALDAVPARIAPAAVRAWLAALPGVAEVHDLHIWALSTTEVALTAHLVRGPGVDDQGLIRAAEAGLAERFRIGHATLQIETAASAADCHLRPPGIV